MAKLEKVQPARAVQRSSRRSNQGIQGTRRARWIRRSRRGAVSSMDYFLVLAIILPLVLIIFRFAPRMIQLVYEMTIVIVGGPTM